MPAPPSNGGARKKRAYERPFSPITKPPIDRDLHVYDFESKYEWSQDPGFTRPFLCGFLSGEHIYTPYFNDHVTRPNEDFRRQVVEKGGCVSQFCETLFALDRQGKFDDRFTADHADVYAHNGGRFDATFLLVWLYLHRDQYDVKMVCVQGRVQSLTVTPKGKKDTKKNNISILDSALLLPMKLSEATTLFSRGESKLADFDQKLPEWEVEKWIEYNRRDCVGLRDALRGFRDLLQREGGEIGMTAPSSAMKLFRRRFLHRSFDRAKHFAWCDGVCQGCTRGDDCDGKCHGCLHDWIRRGYFGGRVEIFERFAPPPVFYYDRNSSYPASMCEPMPVGKPVAVLSNDAFCQEAESRRAAGQLGFVEATVHVPTTCSIPPLPYLHEGKLKFPAGEFGGIFEYDELSLLNDPFVNGRVLHVDRAVFFQGEVIFKDFIHTLYQYRLAAAAVKRKKKLDPSYVHTDADLAALALGELAKLMMNSPYGKFAMNAEREEIFFVGKGDPWPDHGKPIDGRDEAECYVWTRPKWVDPAYVIPQISARVTALGRIAWWRAAKSIVERGGRVFSGDTDSLQTSIEFDDDMIDESELGKWKREYEKEIEDKGMTFWSPKFYASDTGKIVHMKGVPRKFQTKDMFDRLIHGGELRATPHYFVDEQSEYFATLDWAKENRSERMTLSKTVLRGIPKGGKQGISMLDSVKRLRSVYDKRIVHDDGTTSPIVLTGEI